MKLRLPHSLLALFGTLLLSPLALADSTSTSCNIVFVGDSITQGGKWGGSTYGQWSYRYQFFKILVDQDVDYNPIGTCDYTSTGTNEVTASKTYRGYTFDSTHEAEASARTYTWAGLTSDQSYTNSYPGCRKTADEGTVWNALGLANPYTDCDADHYYRNGTLTEYAGDNSSYYDEDGNATADTVCIMIGINDLIQVRAGGNGGDYTMADVIENVRRIVEAYQTYNPNINVVVTALLPTDSSNATYGMSQVYNNLLEEAIASWSTDSSTVTYADVSTGLSVENHYDTGGAHPLDQGELIIAGNLADALGYGQRTLGLSGKAATSLAHHADLASVSDITGHAGYSESGSVSWSTFSTTTTGSATGTTSGEAVSGLTLYSGTDSSMSLTLDDDDGWDIDASTGYTVTASLQMYNISDNEISLSFGTGDATTGEGMITVTSTGIYWGTSSDTILYETAMTDMNDLRIVYMQEDNTQGVDAGYYVWLNNQLIGEALSAYTTTGTDALTLSSASGTLTYASIVDLSWEDSSYCSDYTYIAKLYNSTSMADISATTVSLGSESTSLSSDVVTSTDIAQFTSASTYTTSSTDGTLAVYGLQFTASGTTTVSIGTSTTTDTVEIGAGGISVASGANARIARVTVSEAQTWDVASGSYLRIGTSAANNGRLLSDFLTDDHTVTIKGGGTVIVDTPVTSKSTGTSSTVRVDISDIDWVVTGGSTLASIGNNASGMYIGGFGIGSITLDNGTLQVNYAADSSGAASQGNWAWINDIYVANGGGVINHYSYSGNNRYHVLAGDIALADGASADTAKLTLKSSNATSPSEGYGFILAGDNTAYTGKLVIESGTYVRVGLDDYTSSTLASGDNGTLTSGVIDNSGTITLTRTDEWETDASITGTGALHVGTSVSAFAVDGQVVTFNNGITSTGETTVYDGSTLKFSSTGYLDNGAVNIKALGDSAALANVVITTASIAAQSGTGTIADASVTLAAGSLAIQNVLLSGSGTVAGESKETSTATLDSVSLSAGTFQMKTVTLDASSSVTGAGSTETTLELDDVLIILDDSNATATTTATATATAEAAVAVLTSAALVSDVALVSEEASVEESAGTAIADLLSATGTDTLTITTTIINSASVEASSLLLDLSAYTDTLSAGNYSTVEVVLGSDSTITDGSKIYATVDNGETYSLYAAVENGSVLYTVASAIADPTATDSIPEPATSALALLGLAGLAARRRRK